MKESEWLKILVSNFLFYKFLQNKLFLIYKHNIEVCYKIWARNLMYRLVKMIAYLISAFSVFKSIL